MPAPRARQIIVTAAGRRRLSKPACSRAAGCQQVIRARIVPDTARGCPDAEISRRHGAAAGTVRLWRGRYAGEGMAGLVGRRRSGRPPRFTPVRSAGVKALACQLPAGTGVPLSRWSCPDFAARATRVPDLCAGIFDGSPPGDGGYVISSGERTPVQARCRCHPALPPGRSRAMRVSHEYERGGAPACLAVCDVHRVRVTGLCPDTTGTGPFTGLAGEVMITPTVALPLSNDCGQ